MHTILLNNILNSGKKAQEDVLKIRNSFFVSSQMFTDHQISLQEHSKWLYNLKNNKNQIVFLVLHRTSERVKATRTLGAISLNNIDFKNKNTDWAFYLNEKTLWVLVHHLNLTLLIMYLKKCLKT